MKQNNSIEGLPWNKAAHITSFVPSRPLLKITRAYAMYYCDSYLIRRAAKLNDLSEQGVYTAHIGPT